MCGIAGLILRRLPSDEVLRERVSAMSAAVAHRGPDGAGLWSDPQAGIALAHRRLAILDLLETGAQPMVSASGRLVMSYNGEIYNFREIRQTLQQEGIRFRGTSDSEVLLEAWDRWGSARVLPMLNGMFAIAIWDREARSLTLARDHFGVKPLLWHDCEDGFFFASELKALRRDPACPKEIDPASLKAFLRHGAVPAPWTILRNVRKLEPGSVLHWQQGQKPKVERYWSPVTAILTGQADPHQGSFAEIAGEGERLIGDSVERQMVSDVQIGAFLSGGIDSSLVASFMQQRSSSPIDTFTIGFEEQAFDEAPHAAAIARHLGTRHHTLQTSAREALALAAQIADVYDEPFADSSQLPTLLLSRLVRKHVTVALSGDGGDETFGGYQRYAWGHSLARYQDSLPGLIRRTLAQASALLPVSILDPVARRLFAAGQHPGRNLQRALSLGAAPDFVSGYRQFLALMTDQAACTRIRDEHQSEGYDASVTAGIDDLLGRMRTIDAVSYLPDDILVKVDRASMSVGLEMRVPLLDRTLWEWTARISSLHLGRGAEGKRLLKTILGKSVPETLFQRPKKGFAVPLAAWLCGELRPFAESLLAPTSLAETGYFDADAIQKLWARHLDGREDHSPFLWAVMMFEAWRHNSTPKTLTS
ncbi:MAG: asparagine synthase (glutamine-hydrolyzing) [Beijerinckiaceae bacterium]